MNIRRLLRSVQAQLSAQEQGKRPRPSTSPPPPPSRAQLGAVLPPQPPQPPPNMSVDLETGEIFMTGDWNPQPAHAAQQAVAARAPSAVPGPLADRKVGGSGKVAREGGAAGSGPRSLAGTELPPSGVARPATVKAARSSSPARLVRNASRAKARRLLLRSGVLRPAPTTTAAGATMSATTTAAAAAGVPVVHAKRHASPNADEQSRKLSKTVRVFDRGQSP
jgi:hypothetical protein